MLLCFRPLRTSISFHCCSERLDPCSRFALQTKDWVGRLSGLGSSVGTMDRPNKSFNNEEKPQHYDMMHGRNTNSLHDAMQHTSLAVPNLDSKSEFPSISESVNWGGRSTGKMKKIDLSQKTMDSPQPTGFPEENRAYTTPLQDEITLEATSLNARTIMHASSNDSKAFDNDKRTMSKMKANVDLSAMAGDLSQPDGCPLERRCYTHPPGNAHFSSVSMKKQTGQRSGPSSVNTEFHSKDVRAIPPPMCRTDSKSSSKETHYVKQGGQSCPRDLHMSSHVESTANELQGMSLPTQFGKRSLTSTGMYHTQSGSHPNKGRWSGNSNRSQGSQWIKPFDICESSLGASSSSTNKQMWVKKLVTDGTGEILRPGMVLFKNYIPLDNQVKIVRTCRDLGVGEGGFYQPGFDDGPKLRLQMMCLGLDWDPQTRKYGEMRRLDGARPPAIPFNFISLTEKAIEAAHNLIKTDISEGNAVDILPHMHPNICIVNFYNTSGRLGLHQDKDESRESLQKGLPVVSISLGDSAEFLYGDNRDIENAEKILLESGDVLIFGGSSRHIFHSVASIVPNSAPAGFQQATKLRPGRLNLTFREF